MKKVSILSLFICLLLASKMSGQITQPNDSARLKVTRARSADNKTYYWLKDVDTKENFYTVCSCIQKHKKGDIVMVARKDMEFIEGKVTFDKPIHSPKN